MQHNPYNELPDNSFWKKGVEQSDPHELKGIHTAKWRIKKNDVVVTMGSCFAQHIANWMRNKNLNVPFYDSTENIHSPSFAANYGNVYTVKQALQLVNEVIGNRQSSEPAWQADAGFIDPLRPNVFIKPFSTVEDLLESRALHLKNLKKAFSELDVFIFTLGLTETWQINACKTVLPTAPGILGGDYKTDNYSFVNYTYNEVLQDLEDLHEAIRLLRKNKPFRSLLTVSPVPLTATADNRHILVSSTYSKAVLRAVAGDFASKHNQSDYFPSFEIINNPAAASTHFENNYRTIKKSSVNTVMGIFANSCLDETPVTLNNTENSVQDIDCEDALLDAFVPSKPTRESYNKKIFFFGDSHLSSVKRWVQSKVPDEKFHYIPHQWLKTNDGSGLLHSKFQKFEFKPQYHDKIQDIVIHTPETVVLVGECLFGDGIIRHHGKLKAGFLGCKGADITPQMPFVDKVEDSLVRFYKKEVRRKINFVKNLESQSDYKHIKWMCAPDIPYKSAVFRFGKEFVESGSYQIHKEAYYQAFLLVNKGLQRTEFIFHDWSSLCDKSGFTLDKYRASESNWDIHCNPDYYAGAIKQLGL
ncbi:GSCFA domain-containing protein [Kordiimonas pumila]|uniref:GSCFA domain-containing protein n=1 Tax=Kordiimonas pumila TaxID=2161677 RepID=A0ABV7D2D9_9PROT|nr:GSCFA domain-containing protein [Kordiimonas pumila]